VDDLNDSPQGKNSGDCFALRHFAQILWQFPLRQFGAQGRSLRRIYHFCCTFCDIYRQ
jgi:hypothetical protein